MTKETLHANGYTVERISKAQARKAHNEAHHCIYITTADGGLHYISSFDWDEEHEYDFDAEIEATEWRLGYKLKSPHFFDFDYSVRTKEGA